MIRTVFQALTVFFLLVLVPVKNLLADCAGGVAAWPESKEISSSPIILLEGYMNMKAVVQNIGEKHRLYLEGTDGKQIELKVQQKWESGFHLAQVLLKPVESLKAGNTYTLKIEGLSDTDKPMFVFSNKEDGTIGDKTWNVIQKAVGKSIFNGSPSYKETTCRNRGGSEEIFAVFTMNLNQENLVLVEVYEKKNKKIKSIFYIKPASSGEVRIGKGMCYGTFTIKKDTQYILRFRPLDISGQAGSYSSNIKFKTSCSIQ